MQEASIISQNAERRTQNAERRTIIIPTDNAKKIYHTIDLLHQQTLLPDEIVVIEDTDDEGKPEITEKYPDVKYIRTKRKEFDHGRTRDTALRSSIGDYIIFITSDAIPSDSHFIENITAPFSTDEKIAVSAGRQIPRPDAWPFERLVRTFNYPSVSRVRSASDIPELGVKTFFTSDCCCAYRRDIYEELGGFDFPIKTAEDFLFAARAVNAGYKIAYTADAGVIHSHNLTLAQQYRRNFLTGYESEKHKEYFCGVSQEKEGMRLVKYVSFELLKRGRLLSFIRFGFDCVARFLGNKMGKRAFRNEMKC